MAQENIVAPFKAQQEDVGALSSEKSASNESLVSGFGESVPPSGEGNTSSEQSAKLSADEPIVPRVPKKNSSDQVPDNKTIVEHFASLGKTGGKKNA